MALEDDLYGEENLDYEQEEVDDDIQDEDVAIHFLQPAAHGNTVRYGEFKRGCVRSHMIYSRHASSHVYHFVASLAISRVYIPSITSWSSPNGN